MRKRPVKDISGDRYGKLVVLHFSGWREHRGGQRRSLWNCQCDCGNTVITTSTSLRTGHSKSCGCFHIEQITTHGLSKSPEYGVFSGICDRCYNPNAAYYHCYGGIGIKLEGSWDLPAPEGFLNFYKDMGPRPTEKHTIERVDVKKGYSKDNCIWTDNLNLQSFNQGMDKRNKSGRTGVGFDPERNKWTANIGYKNTTIHLGRYDTFEKAVAAREAAELKYFGFIKEQAFEEFNE